ncbi:MAG: haloacid dehalogenase [Armatimonadetes bacterium]|jgi:translin|nr:haloacid dehalogenase [Armatimonadota bacterium]
MAKLEQILDGVRARMDDANRAREHALGLSREIIRYAANSIRATHRGEFEQAEVLLHEARDRVCGLREALQENAGIYWTGYVQDAQKEFAEASITLALVRGQEPPGPEEIQVEHAAYLNGLGEAAGELRRHFLDLLRAGQVARAEQILAVMDDVYDGLATFDYPDALTAGLRRTADMVRGVLERSRGDLTAAIRQEQLQEALRRVEEQSNAVP